MAAAFLIAGLATPIGTPAAGVLFDSAGQTSTFVAVAALIGLITIAIHLNRPMRELSRPGTSLSPCARRDRRPRHVSHLDNRRALGRRRQRLDTGELGWRYRARIR